MRTSSLHALLLTLLRHTGLSAVPSTCQVSSFLRSPCLRSPPPGDCMSPTFMSLRPLNAPAPQRGSQDITLFVTSIPMRSPMKAGPCPAAQALTCIRQIETWAVRSATGNPSRVGVSDLGAQLSNLTSGLNGRRSLGKLCMTIA